MDQELDRLLARLGTGSPDPRLDALEPRVWARIDARRAPTWSPSLRWQASAAVFALSLGAAVGGAAADRPGEAGEMAVFSAHAALAPSTIFEGRR